MVRPSPCPPARLRRGADSFAVEDVQFFLLDFARRQHVFPIFLRALAFEEFQVVPDFTRHGFGLAPDFFNQDFLRAHGFIFRQNLLLAIRITLLNGLILARHLSRGRVSNCDKQELQGGYELVAIHLGIRRFVQLDLLGRALRAAHEPRQTCGRYAGRFLHPRSGPITHLLPVATGGFWD